MRTGLDMQEGEKGGDPKTLQIRKLDTGTDTYRDPQKIVLGHKEGGDSTDFSPMRPGSPQDLLKQVQTTPDVGL